MRRSFELQAADLFESCRIEKPDKPTALVDHDQTGGAGRIVGVRSRSNHRHSGKGEDYQEGASFLSHTVHHLDTAPYSELLRSIPPSTGRESWSETRLCRIKRLWQVTSSRP